SIVLITSIVSRGYHLIIYSCKNTISDDPESFLPINQNMSSEDVDVIEIKDHLTVPQ
ncbi:190_t:CDS:1, partial [Funneliformis caledonium]